MPGFERFDDAERKEVQEVLETGVLFRYGFDSARRGRWKAFEFEKAFARRLGVRFCHLCSNGTASLSIALASCGIGAGDEVIVPPFTFVATVEAVLLAGAIPIFAEIDETLCLDPDAVKKTISGRTKAVIVVHMCGAMARIDEMQSVCREHDVVLIEDACQSVGATFQGQAIGTFGHMGCFSFDPVKTITCGEGGAVATDDEKRYRTAMAFADHGHDHIGTDRGREGHPILGTNFRISELNAAVGLAQLKKLDTFLEIQRTHKHRLLEMMRAFPRITPRHIPDDDGDSATFLSFSLPDEAGARKTASALAEKGVDGCFYWYDNNWHYLRQWDHIKGLKAPAKLPIRLIESRPDYQKLHLPRSDSIMSRMISMQIKLSWTEVDIKKRMDAMADIFSEI